MAAGDGSSGERPVARSDPGKIMVTTVRPNPFKIGRWQRDEKLHLPHFRSVAEPITMAVLLHHAQYCPSCPSHPFQQGRSDLGHSTQAMASTRNENPFKTHLKYPSTEQPRAVFMQQWAEFRWVNSWHLGHTWLAKLEQCIRPIIASSPWQPSPIEQGSSKASVPHDRQPQAASSNPDPASRQHHKSSESWTSEW
ncbi:hypothetical protein ACLOJK_022568 [Asimina triloba]